MKIVLLSLAVLLASVTAWPQPKTADVENQNIEKVVDGIIIALIQALSQLIKDRNLDPYRLDNLQVSWQLPNADFLGASASVQNVALDGLSNIAINHVSYNLFTGALLIDVSFPQVAGSVGSASGEVQVFTRTLSGSGSGSLVLNGVRLHGGAIVRIGVTGVVVEQVQVALTVGSIDSNINLVLLGLDVSETVNNLLGNIIPNILEVYGQTISEIIAHVIQRIIERLL